MKARGGADHRRSRAAFALFGNGSGLCGGCADSTFGSAQWKSHCLSSLVTLSLLRLAVRKQGKPNNYRCRQSLRCRRRRWLPTPFPNTFDSCRGHLGPPFRQDSIACRSIRPDGLLARNPPNGCTSCERSTSPPLSPWIRSGQPPTAGSVWRKGACRAARKGTVLAAKAVETQGKGTVSDLPGRLQRADRHVAGQPR